MSREFRSRKSDKRFPTPGSKNTVIHRDGESKRRKCDAILLKKLDIETVTQLKARKYRCSSKVKKILSLMCHSRCAVTDPLRHKGREGRGDNRWERTRKKGEIGIWQDS